MVRGISPPPSGPVEGFCAPKPGMKRAKDDFCSIELGNDIHHSGMDPEALLCRKSEAYRAQPSYRDLNVSAVFGLHVITHKLIN